jgi:hypothetical protein
MSEPNGQFSANANLKRFHLLNPRYQGEAFPENLIKLSASDG